MFGRVCYDHDHVWRLAARKPRPQRDDPALLRPREPFRFETNPQPWRAIAILRDPIHLVVSHYWYDYDGHEGGKRFDNATEGLVYQLVKKRWYHGVAESNQVARRNGPDKVRASRNLGCFEFFHYLLIDQCPRV